jgi:hypothetical protein
MKLNKMLLVVALVLSVILGFGITSCQKMERPALVIIPDPPPPPYNPLKSYFAFENNVVDSGELKLTATASNVTYAAGVSGQAMQGAANSYVLLSTPGDTLKNLGSYTISFWMNSGPATNATGIFAISNTKEFWGNLEIFLEGYSVDATTAFLKVHMFNKNAADKENWAEVKIPNVFGKWSHIAITYDGATSTFKIFGNGATVVNSVLKNGAYGPIAFADAGGAVIGAMQFMTTPSLTTNHGAEPWARNFSGSLDQFRIYNKALSDAEVTTLFTTKR